MAQCSIAVLSAGPGAAREGMRENARGKIFVALLPVLPCATPVLKKVSERLVVGNKSHGDGSHGQQYVSGPITVAVRRWWLFTFSFCCSAQAHCFTVTCEDEKTDQ